MRGKPFLFICTACLVILAACTPPTRVPPAGPGSAGLGSSGSGSASATSEPSNTPAPSATPSAGVSAEPTATSGGSGFSVSTSEPGAAVTLSAPGEGSGGGVITPGADGNLAVTLADQGKTVRLKVGERFLLNLGEGYDWSPEVADQTVVSRVPNISVIRGAQGIYEAHQPGSTTLNVTGDPTCLKSDPPCAMPSRMFKVTIEVQ